MLQRIQSVYLSVSALLLVLGMFLPWATYFAGDEVGYLLVFSAETPVSTTPLLMTLLLALAAVVVTVFAFRNRRRQMMLTRDTMALEALVLAGFAWCHSDMIGVYGQYGDSLEMGYGVVVVFPVLTIVLTWMALRGIKKDDDLVRSADRLR